MTEVSFYTGVPDRLPYLCRLLRKAAQAGVNTGVCGPARLLDRLDQALWTFESTGFLPHVRVGARGVSDFQLRRTPIVLAERPLDLPHRQALLNLEASIPEGFEGFERVLEVVSQDEEQMRAGRDRFRRYKQLGYEVRHHVITPDRSAGARTGGDA
ncbi:DNA polymerase III subunit chi [Pelomonas sp. CA6]|uniref:DNA polymerase III subunit chi n=1 Tax=Pelomonas sp. CA6 TaxID=2907999 RepID=UPI001F4BF6E2|nr:DNA polymerase III subunit chi [Pelomonas sp. CA6]MCH7344138.1 DNA polymerase III subunit chi [Pelomonas sp. CA6]